LKAIIESSPVKRVAMIPRVVGILVPLICAVLSGCGGREDYREVTGSVTYKGERVTDGTIQFFSDEKQPAMLGGASIRDGEYRLPPEHGLKPGHYLVRISWREVLTDPNQKQPAMGGVKSRERIPAKYNSETTLKVEVRAEGRPQFDFDLQ
jgi:hypothetical protein